MCRHFYFRNPNRHFHGKTCTFGIMCFWGKLYVYIYMFNLYFLCILNTKGYCKSSLIIFKKSFVNCSNITYFKYYKLILWNFTPFKWSFEIVFELFSKKIFYILFLKCYFNIYLSIIFAFDVEKQTNNFKNSPLEG